MDKAKRVTIKAVLKTIDCKHLNLFKGEGYFYFVYDNPETDTYETANVPVFALNHLEFDQWIVEGYDFVKTMAAVELEKKLKASAFVPPQLPEEILKALETQNEKICATEMLAYRNKHESQEIVNLIDEITRGQEALRRAQRYLVWMQTEEFDRNAFPAHHYKQEELAKEKQNDC